MIMAWWTTFQADVASNLGMGLEYIFPLVITLIGFVISGKDTQAASALTFVMSVLGFIITYKLGLEYVVILFVMIMSLILMALQLFFDYKEYGGGMI
jgi:hypothetical protein